MVGWICLRSPLRSLLHPEDAELAKNSQGVYFTNVFARIFRACLSYEYLFSSYVLRKTPAKNVGEIDTRC